MITVNQRDEVEWREGMTVRDLLKKLKYTYPHIIVRINGDLVRDEDFKTTTIPDEAHVQLIHLIAGG